MMEYDFARPIAAFALAMAAMAPTQGLTSDVAVPQGCTPIVTAQKDRCVSVTLFNCGETRKSHTYLDGAQAIAITYTPDYDLIEFSYADPKLPTLNVVPGSGRSTRIAELLETGASTADGAYLMNTRIIKNRDYTLAGRNEITGEAEIDGTLFKTGRMYRVFERTPGEGGLEFEIDFYYSAETSVFIEGTWQRSIQGNNLEVFEESLMSLAWPGEEGFLEAQGEVGCG